MPNTGDFPDTPVLLRRLQAIHRALDEGGFDHAFGGAVALGVHAIPRATADLDLNVIADSDSPEGMLASLPSEIEIPDDAVAQLQESGQIRLMWPSPSTAVDIFLPQHPTYHLLVNARAEPAEFLGEGVRVISATDLMVFKMLFDRRKDWADIESLLVARAGDPDEAATIVADIVGPGDHRLAELAKVRADVSAAQPRFPR